MANMNEILGTILNAYPNATFARTNSMGNFLAIEGDVVDGVQTYYGIKVSSLLAKSNARNEAFNPETARAEYLDFMARQDERANKPKKTKTADPAKTAKKVARQGKLLDFMKANANVDFTASQIFSSLPDVYCESSDSNMTVGTDLIALANANPELTFSVDSNKKKHWIYNA